ncbi:MAG: DnaD domain-containing protein [Dehalococcoidia bacterium]
MSDRLSSIPEAAVAFVSLPDSFFVTTLPKIHDLAELKTVLYAAYLILRKQGRGGSDVGVGSRDMRAEIGRLSPELGEEAIQRALASAVEHGALLHKPMDIDGVSEDVYFVSPFLSTGHQRPGGNIFTLYEQNIGMITPMIAEELKEAEKLYPPPWVEEAFREAVRLNKRSWKYIARILERWASEGKDSGEHKGNAEKGGPDKYVKGKYGHLVKR